MRPRLLILVLGALVLFEFLFLFRYQIICTGEARCYRMNRWTGEIVLVVANKMLKVEKPQ